MERKWNYSFLEYMSKTWLSVGCRYLQIEFAVAETAGSKQRLVNRGLIHENLEAVK